MFFDNFVNLCERKGVKPSRALTEAGVPRSAYTYWKSEAKAGNDAKPTNQNAVKLAQYFGVTVDYLLTGEQKETAPQPQNGREADIQAILDVLRKQSDEDYEFSMAAIRKILK